jgi:3-hydroxyisobutyrate dehydrogenase
MTNHSLSGTAQATSRPRLGFVGLGDQGGPIARRLIDSGYDVTLWARRSASLEPFAGSTARIASTPEHLGAASNIVGVCVVNDADVVEVVKQLMAGMSAGGLIVVHSTVSPDTCRRLDREAQRKGLRVIDAPVSGGNAAAREGTLSVVVGADPASFERCREVFGVFASLVLHLGDVGAGQTAKLINNALIAANLALAHEALKLGSALKIDRGSLAGYLKASSGRSFSLDIYSSLPGLAAFAHGARLLDKDLGLLTELASRDGVSASALSRPAQAFLQDVSYAADTDASRN